MHILTHRPFKNDDWEVCGQMCKTEPKEQRPDIDEMIYGEAVITVPSER